MARGPRGVGEATAPRLTRPVRGLVVGKAGRDHELVCRAGKRAAGAGSEWLAAPDAAAAARLLASSEIDIVVADSRSVGSSLRGLTGGPRGKAWCIVVLSTGDDPELVQQMLDAGADCCLPKRLPQRLLEDSLRRLLAGIDKGTEQPGPKSSQFDVSRESL